MARPTSRAAIGLGANLGDRLAAISGAIDFLAALAGVRLVAASDVIETAPVGGRDQPHFLNVVAVFDTELPPGDLLAGGREAERRWGRQRDVRWGPRTLDVDLLGYGDVMSDDPDLTLPHPRAVSRAFVLVPWAQVDPEYPIPGAGRTVAEALAELVAADPDAVSGCRRRPDLSL